MSTRNRHTSNNTSNHSCYTCIEPLVGYTDHPGSCKYLNISSPLASSYIQQCNISDNDDNNNEYECRKSVVSYRSVETYLRRDCVRKGLCSWKDKTQSMITTPVSDCVYTDERTQKLECIYCCDTSLCNRTNLYRITNQFIICLLLISYRNLILF
ncbi:unnamed protein product [Rotaria sp. Silwood1]|nr:unnamed protein product [Rotaria sp. Silwood1]CAF3397084.1 unnamed protein product [Rotaria sp. Silwood1]CAF3411975.1 unnamed protein product [Rotaria sp. Silwood1]CAF4514545.1 unnamed protein product [Rotaria sp. Silwood1]CAF4800328.1 unnamed protein product [Rotaria sp. Silwood1]